MTTLDDAAQTIYTALNADATLRSATYLNGSNKIEKGPTKPDGAANPFITMRTRQVDSLLQQGEVARYTVQIVLTLDNIGDRGSNMRRAGLIQKRLFELLHAQQLTAPAGRTHIATVKAGFGALNVPLESEAQNEHAFIFPYEILIA